LPASAGASNKVEYFAWLNRGEIGSLSIVVQPIHDAFQDIKRRETSHTAAIKRQQAQTGSVERIGLADNLRRLFNRKLLSAESHSR
jgi:hypothetical protein